MTALRITGLAVSRGQRQVLTDVSLDVDAGELVCLVGPNGAGKSTLVSAIAGTLGTSAGSVELMGEPISEMSALEQARRRAVLPQEHTIGFTFTCAEVVQMARHAWARTDQRRDDDAVVAAAMTACDVTGFARRSFESLSGGERGRVALARVLAQGTPILVLDEPTAAMDPHYQEQVMSVVRRAVDGGAAALVVVHDLNLAAAYSDRVAVLAPDEDGCGRLVAVGAPRATLTAERVSEVYGLPMRTHDVEGQHVVLPHRDSD
ncbi:MAG TPA: heme ABC transporter ATP-binding protein [Gordonia sp. (in: high G+C Gram-positive bacteria)]|uniref:heme ABC transporter ATP-binding protein n=1 Tax=unclassified Gordonia (in: high G+C Gram-positive bacteria) TaxID=2657482 RepID=UPI000FA9A1B9|nr:MULTISPECIES: heme ABC transporter ATP-binding protein [unclassified Gordonia (in: high G+C Gram-positive bacteria)]RUP40165.1 MAG: heme ABC transporter ATP-binding protein [Gordonia sp. (in: high G+C Gram-positive bacteria)]HNP55871.1 heme ABC transporter ATP-binding protein [Gordonia sp. (in: high G+C Gram-positive bacteria)]HRC52144.1 heme ABC transporter ATP-binding protein [Gordonia sp. (in: high G+C Gram-positive bacteria)]